MATQVITNRYPTIPDMSPETAKLVNALKLGPEGERKTDRECTHITGVCCDSTLEGVLGRRRIFSAINHVRRNYGIVWQRVKGQGYIECLGWEGIVEKAKSNSRRLHKCARTTAHMINECIKPSEVPLHDRPAVNALAAQHMTLALMTSKKVIQQLEQRNSAEPIDMQKYLESFIGKK